MSQCHLILSMMMTEDGFVSGPSGELDWVLWGPEMDVAALSILERAGLFIAGHHAFADMADYWPNVADTGGPSPEEQAFARRLCAKSKGVVGRPRSVAIWDEREWINPDLLTMGIAQAADSYGTIVAYGGVRTARLLLACDLVDELALFVTPRSIGAGQALFVCPDDMRCRFDLVETHHFTVGGSRMKLHRTYPSGEGRLGAGVSERS